MEEAISATVLNGHNVFETEEMGSFNNSLR